MAPPRWSATLPADLFAGLTVALVAIPQCMAFATICGLPAVAGLYSAVVMGLVSAAISESPKLVVGPAITASTMLLAVLRTVEPTDAQRWPVIAGFTAVLVGVMTIVAAWLNLGRFTRFVSRAVILGLVAGSAALTLGSQLAPMMGLSAGRQSTLLGILWNTISRLGGVHWPAVSVSIGAMVVTLVGARLGPRVPAAFIALALSGVAAWQLEQRGLAGELPTIGALPWSWPSSLTPRYEGPLSSDLLAGAAAICVVGIIQNLSIAKALADRDDQRFRPKRELWALGVANIAAGLLHGFPGSGSFARSALSDLAGARTRVSGIAAAVATTVIAALAAPLARHVTLAAIAGVLVATAITMVSWRELTHVLLRDRDDRVVLLTTVAAVFILPIHWAVLIGLVVSVGLLLGRVGRLHLFEMVRNREGAFREHAIDKATGASRVTMLQVEGPLFFAHADELARKLRAVFRRRPDVTIVRMRRTQQIDFSVLASIDGPVRSYLAGGGHLLMCGLTPAIRETLRNSPLGAALGADNLMAANREVFGSARAAIERAQSLCRDAADARPMFREGESPAE
ncbi:putative sulfate transporter [Phycisphaerae bacterium RAS1]|nr:putative sulfate transporter [Phycisphaerae bacterium RAS1]